MIGEEGAVGVLFGVRGLVTAFIDIDLSMPSFREIGEEETMNDE